MQENDYLNETTLRDIGEYVDSSKLNELNRPKAILWLKFYSDWFGIKDIDLKNFFILYEKGKKLPGMTMVLVPHGLTLSSFFTTFKEKGLIESKIENPDDEIQNIRRKRATYLLYAKLKFTLLEELLVEMFNVYTTGDFLPYGHRLVGKNFFRTGYSLATDGKRISIESKAKEGKRIGLIIRKENF